jgi:hypothetical protein
VIYRLGRGVRHWSDIHRWTTCMWIVSSKTNDASRRRIINTSSIKFFPSRSFINLHNSSSIFFAYLSNTKSIINWISLWEGDGSGRTTGITSDLLKMIGVVSLRTVLCSVTSQHERKNSSRLMRYASNVLRPPPSGCRRYVWGYCPYRGRICCWQSFHPSSLTYLK